MQSPLTKGGGFGYGIDSPNTILGFLVGGVVFAAMGVGLYEYLGPSNPTLGKMALILGPFFGILMLILAESMYVGSRAGKPREARKMTQNIPWGGNEVVLDVGCGRGAATVPAAKYLTSGMVVGLDSWNRRHISGNSARSLLVNARVNSVDGKLSPVMGIPTKLPFAKEAFDVVISCLSLGHLSDKVERREAVSELTLSLRKGGRISILVYGRSDEYREDLVAAGIADVKIERYRLGLFPPVQGITGRKPFS